MLISAYYYNRFPDVFIMKLVKRISQYNHHLYSIIAYVKCPLLVPIRLVSLSLSGLIIAIWFLPFLFANPFLRVIISYRYMNIPSEWGATQWFSQLSPPGLEPVPSRLESDDIPVDQSALAYPQVTLMAIENSRNLQNAINWK